MFGSVKEILDHFRDHLVATGKSAHTVEAYTYDLCLFAEWFLQTDVREYRSHLLTVKDYEPATVNRKLASISAFCEWARETDLVPADPTERISYVDQVRAGPKWLDKNERYALLRAV